MLKFLLDQKNTTAYKLEKDSGVSHAAILDLCNEKTDVTRCSCDVMYKLAKTLKIQMGKLYRTLIYEDLSIFTYDESFDQFKKSLLEEYRHSSYKTFLKKYLSNQTVLDYWSKHQSPEAFYLLSLIDICCVEHNLPLVRDYQTIRSMRLDKFYVNEETFSLLMNKKIKAVDLYNNASDFFLIHGIVEEEFE